MKAFIISLAFASTATALYALRFRSETNYKKLASFMAVMMAAEWFVEANFLPEDAFGYELAVVLFAICSLVILAIFIITKIEHSASPQNEACVNQNPANKE